MAMVACATGLTAAGCGAGHEGPTSGPPRTDRATVRLLFAGDVMLGRGVVRLASVNPPALFAGVRPQLASADVAIANLESPLTARPHDPSAGPYALEAPPASARLLAAAGFDAMAIANNHAGDAGPGTVADTERALARAGLRAVGGGESAGEAYRARVMSVRGVRVALLSVDATGQGPRAMGGGAGVAWWDEDRVRVAVRDAAERADLVAVGVHGGGEYIPGTDPYLMRLARKLSSFGADVVWGTGPHVVQPIRLIRAAGRARPTLVATSLGNLLFDQTMPGTRRGALLEVVGGRDGVRAWRVGVTEGHGGPPRFVRWRSPSRDAAWSAGSWWALARGAPSATAPRAPALRGFRGDVVDASVGDADADGRSELVVAFRRPFRPTRANALLPRSAIVDRHGRTAHVGIFRLRDRRERWVAGTLLRPVGRLAVCDGTLAVSYTSLDAATVIATGAWQWGGFGFLTLPDLPGLGTPACADVDGDGRLDPLVLERSAR